MNRLINNKKLNWSRGKLEHLSHCPACFAQDKIKFLFVRQDDEKILKDEWSIYKCDQCTSTFVNPQPAVESLPELYKDYSTHNAVETQAVDSSQSLIWRLIRGYLYKRFDMTFVGSRLAFGYWIFKTIPPIKNKLDRYGRNLSNQRFKTKGRLLDLGCGAGEFIGLAQRMGWETYGCDFDPVVAEHCNNLNFNVRLGGLEAFSTYETFDVITLNQVIEHVKNPQQLIKDCYAKLNPGGMLWIGTPNPNASGAKLFKAAWAGWHPPYHLCLPSQSELKRWLAESGFEHINVQKRGFHAKFNWNASQNLVNKFKITKPKQIKLNLLLADLKNSVTVSSGEETVIVGFKL